MTDSIDHPTLLEAISAAVKEGQKHIKTLEKDLDECARLLRVEQSRGIFTKVSTNIENMKALMEFGDELRNSLARLHRPDISGDDILSQKEFLNVFQAMVSAFEARDWVTLADLIQYELHPMITRGTEDLALLEGKLEKK